MATRRPKVYQPPGFGLIIAGHESPYKFDEPSLDIQWWLSRDSHRELMRGWRKRYG